MHHSHPSSHITYLTHLSGPSFTDHSHHVSHRTSCTSDIIHIMHHPHLAEHFTSHVASQVTAHFTSCVGQCLVMLKVHFFFFWGGAKHLLELWLHPLHVLHMATAQSTNTTFANWTLVSTNLCAPLWAATRMPHRTALFTSGTHACWSAPNKLASNYGPGDAGNNIGNWQPTGKVQNVGMTL